MTKKKPEMERGSGEDEREGGSETQAGQAGETAKNRRWPAQRSPRAVWNASQQRRVTPSLNRIFVYDPLSYLFQRAIEKCIIQIR